MELRTQALHREARGEPLLEGKRLRRVSLDVFEASRDVAQGRIFHRQVLRELLDLVFEFLNFLRIHED